MFPRGEIKRNLLATLEIAMFMRQGPERFGEDFREMLRSWALFAIFLPMTFLSLYYLQPEDPAFSKISYGFLAFLVLIKIIITTAAYVAIIYGIARQYDRKQYFYVTITALNWAAIITSLMLMPGILGVALDHYQWPELTNYHIFLAIYGYALGAFTMTFTMRIPWEMATFLSIISMALDQSSLQFMKWMIDYFF